MLIDLTVLPIVLKSDCPGRVVIRTTTYGLIDARQTTVYLVNENASGDVLRTKVAYDATLDVQGKHTVRETFLYQINRPGQRVGPAGATSFRPVARAYYTGQVRSIPASGGAIEDWTFKITQTQLGDTQQQVWTVHNERIPLVSFVVDPLQHTRAEAPLLRHADALRNPVSAQPDLYDYM
jgi:hypothetical protein